MRRVAAKLGRAFGGLKVRYKLMLLHNLFYLILTCGVYFSLMPSIEGWVAEAWARRGVAEREFYDAIVQRARITIFVVLGVTYWLAVLILEGFVMRFYIHRPLRMLLDADAASRGGDTRSELIDESLIQGDELGWLMASRNATVRKLREHEQELERTLLRLEEAAADLRKKNYLLETAKQNIADQDRLASLGMLTASVAHEINTPLAVLRGSAEKLLEEASDEPVRLRLDRMLRVINRLQRIGDIMLDFARVRQQAHEPVFLRPVVEEAWNLISIDERAPRVTFENHVGHGDSVRGNADRLTQLFVNLLRNSLYAVRDHGHIVVSSRRSGDEWRVRVEDDGPGIPADILPDVFEAFVTTRLDARGTGLGLTVAEGIAHQHGGSIVASNRPQGGACLEVRLPEAPAGPREPQPAATQSLT